MNLMNMNLFKFCFFVFKDKSSTVFGISGQVDELCTANNRLFEDGSGFHATATRRSNSVAQIGFVRHNAPVRDTMLRSGTQRIHL